MIRCAGNRERVILPEAALPERPPPRAVAAVAGDEGTDEEEEEQFK